MSYILAFDIERSGATNKYSTIAIGVSVIDEEFNKLESKLWRNYVPDKTSFEPRCWNEFWSKRINVLNEFITTPTTLDTLENEKNIIEQFQEFRRQWEAKAKSENKKLIVCCDNLIYDGGFINELIMTYTNDLPLPYSASYPQKFSSLWETHSMQKGLLSVVDSKFTSNWGLTDRMFELYNVDRPTVDHDHLPQNDAYTIAYDMAVMLRIRQGTLSRRPRNTIEKILSYFNLLR